PDEDNDDEGLTAKDVARLHRALEALPARERRAVVLRYLEGAPPAQIAGELGVTEGNARQLVHRGLKRLQRLLHETRRASGASTRKRGHDQAWALQEYQTVSMTDARDEQVFLQ